MTGKMLILLAATSSLLALAVPNLSNAGELNQEVCDVTADYSLGAEHYSEAIRRHAEILRKHPNNALAHYHLGFALGMTGDQAGEIREYRQAEARGLKTWDLFLNLGLAQLESGDTEAANESLRKAVLLGPDHSESHFNLAFVDVRRGMLPDAEGEILASLHLNPGQADARDLLGVIYAEEGQSARAAAVWEQLLRDEPDYAPAQTNLARLRGSEPAVSASTVAFGYGR
jgi:Flp pilus assembly protein TadD